MANNRKILFVDDEPNIRLTLPSILRMHGFEVTSTASVAEALAAMQTDDFDVLIADLNIGQPGDGFTVVSAMRRTQPNAVTLILTGYPAFETALEAIRRQVDDYLVKPADVHHLVEVIERNLEHEHDESHQIKPQKLSNVLRLHEDDVKEKWFESVMAEGIFGDSKLSKQEICANIADIISEMIEMLDSYPGAISKRALEAATEHGRLRRRQGFSPGVLAQEARNLRQALYAFIHQNLLAVNTSFVISDMTVLSDTLDRQTAAALDGYAAEGEVAA